MHTPEIKEEQLDIKKIPVKNKALAVRLQESVKKMKYIQIVEEMRGHNRKKTWMVESSSDDDGSLEREDENVNNEN